MIRIFFLALINFYTLCASSINPALLEIEAKLFPKIIMLDEQIDQKLVNGKLYINIIFQNRYRKEAQLMKKLLDKKVVYGKRIKVVLTKERALKNPSAYILFTDSQKAKKLFTALAKKNRLILSALPSAIDGAMVSIAVNSKVHPLLNPSAIKQSKIKLNPIIFKVSKYYENK
ncbi:MULTISPECIES: hypothetical protein [unclassified Nitratiruptor]|uniref:hypothetical protein n=1 Tax=unclassified Nitratiruptor TaxID=2624044 RepID=UPI001915A09E|nr:MULTISPECIES: hypothetical protein [unclassified Nitratiruptor]BCD59824.1 hypothetical protein NitYY0810_C0583 [Nitratiruptor sp. YY08-10]BCD63748.1 hypothetical protein NitYY0814_C0583 [Nitratiruptor sp. YY08-14]